MNILVCMPKGAVTDTFFNHQNLDMLEKLGNVTYNESTENFSQTEYYHKIKFQDVVIIGWGSPVLDTTVLQNASSLKLVVHMAGSVAPFLCNEVYEKGIRVICGNEVMAQSVAEGVISYILAFNRDIPYFSTSLKQKGMWKPKTFNTRSLVGKTIGIVSYGSISKYLIEMLRGFDVNILLYSRGVECGYSEKLNLKVVTLEELFATSDIISLQTALNENTINMIDSSYLNLIQEGAIFINTARAKVVNERDLIFALKSKRFSAILDVYNIEPLPEDNPYRNMDNVFMMPHMAGPTNECRLIIAKTLIKEIPNVLEGKESIHEVKQQKFSSMSKAI